jgi:hypothetical protein
MGSIEYTEFFNGLFRKNVDEEYLKTKQELKRAKKLIDDSRGRVDLVKFTSSNNSGELFFPGGYCVYEFDALLEQLPNSHNIVVVSPELQTCVTVYNRRNFNK